MTGHGDGCSAGEPLSAAREGIRRHVLVTGAAGRIGSYFAAHAHDRYELRLMVQHLDQGESLRPYGEVVAGDLRDLAAMKRLCAGIDTVVHLAGNPDPDATWRDLLDPNIVGAYHTFVAAKAAGCRRVVYASSIHAVSGYPPERQVRTDDPVNPGDLYGVSKCFGEALGRYMAEQEGLSVIALRIGAFLSPEEASGEGGARLLDSFVSRRDLRSLIERSIDVEGLSFAILHGLSDNRVTRLDLSDTRALVGYAPRDDAAAINPALRDIARERTTHAYNVVRGHERSGLREDL